MKKIAMIGTGYVGLVTGVCLAEMGHQVVCLDIDDKKVESLRAHTLPFYEPGLEELFSKCVKKGLLTFTHRYDEAIPGAELCFLCLPTPSNEDSSCDLTYIMQAAKQLAEAMDNTMVIVNKSTVPVGTAALVQAAIQETLEERKIDLSFDVVSNPEFLREGSAVADCMKPDRILLGSESPEATAIMKELYAPFECSPEKIIVMDTASAELSKYAANAMLASRISLMNSLSLFCEAVGGDIEKVRLAMGADKRIGYSYLRPGLGFGGSCLPKDVRALKIMMDQKGLENSLFESILTINQNQKEAFFQKILQFYGTLEGKTLAIWGLSFKPDTDDLREAPSLYLISQLAGAGAHLRLYDPVAMPKAQFLLRDAPNIHFCEDEYDSAQNADGIILVTEWQRFLTADFSQITPLMKRTAFFDGRNQMNAEEMRDRGFEYLSIGKGSSILAEIR